MPLRAKMPLVGAHSHAEDVVEARCFDKCGLSRQMHSEWEVPCAVAGQYMITCIRTNFLLNASLSVRSNGTLLETSF